MTPETFETGKEGIFSIPHEVYRAAEGLNHSLIKAAKTPAHVHSYLNNPKVVTRAMQFGTLSHDEVVPFDEAVKSASMGAGYHIRPDTYGPEEKKWNGNANLCKEWLEEHNDLPVITATEEIALKGMVARLKSDPYIAGMLENGAKEQSLFVHDPSGMMRKIRIDIRITDATGKVYHVDYKTTTDAVGFARLAWKNEYHIQSSYYPDTEKMLTGEDASFMFLAQEKTAPYEFILYAASDDFNEAGRKLYHERIAIINRYLDGDRSGYTRDIQLLDVPQWEKRKLPL